MATTFPLEQLGWRLHLSLAADDGADGSATMALVRGARAGDLEAFDKLMQLEERRVYRTALHLLGRPEDAEDAVQETFLRVHRGLRGYDTDRPWRSWLYAVAVNACRDISFSVKPTQVVNEKNGRSVRLSDLRAEWNIPYRDDVTNFETGQTSTQTLTRTLQVQTNLAVPEGKLVVVGKAGSSTSAEAIFLVLRARLDD